jgi:hypothetical protein
MFPGQGLRSRMGKPGNPVRTGDKNTFYEVDADNLII